ncbi:MAG: gamma-glutamylcyclotransferase [Anaerolineae bacterium]|nr:gamma-glutamylcyclotransferase [Anaerolineae bacterium]
MLLSAETIDAEHVGGLDQPPIFVYGSLRHGMENYGLLRGRTLSEVPATLVGAQMYSLGWYPMLVEAADEYSVRGELMILHPQHYSRVLASLDHLEGYNENDEAHSLYLRVRCPAISKSGREVEAWVYMGSEDKIVNRHGEFIPGGDWVRYSQERWTTLRQG